MSKPRLSDYHLLTSTRAAKKLGISRFQLKSWIKEGLLDKPTETRMNKKKPVIYLFDAQWVDKNQETVNQILGKEE